MTIIDAINSGKPFRCADIKSSKEIVNPWLIYRDHSGSWFHYAECETAMKQEHLNKMLVEHFSSENWEIKREKDGLSLQTVSTTEILARRELYPYVLSGKLPREVLDTVIGHIKEQHKMLLKAKGYIK